MPRRTAENAAVWRDRVQRWKESGLTAKAFAELEGLPRPGALSWWRHQLAQRDKKQKAARSTDGALRLVRVEASEVFAQSAHGRSDAGVVAPIEVTCGPYRVVVRARCDFMMLEGVLRTLERVR